MAHAVVIVRISEIRIRRNNGLQTNISTAFIEKMHQVCRPGAFFILNLYSVRCKLFLSRTSVRNYFFITKRLFL